MAQTVLNLVCPTADTGILILCAFCLFQYNPISVESPSHINKFTMGVSNSGLASANNVIISFSAEKMRFLNFTLQPFIQLANSSTGIGHAFLEIKNVPAGQYFLITGYVNSTGPNLNPDEIISNVYSSESIGHSELYVTAIRLLIIGFGLLSLISVFYLIWQYYYRKQNVKEYDYVIKIVD